MDRRSLFQRAGFLVAGSLSVRELSLTDPSGLPNERLARVKRPALHGQSEFLTPVTDPAYGAKGDGHTDDTHAIQRAIDDVGNAGGGLVAIPPGEYVVSSIALRQPDVTLVGASNALNWDGAQSATTLRAAPHGPLPIISITADRVAVENLAIRPASATVTNNAVVATGCSSTTLRGIGVSGVAGISLGGSSVQNKVNRFLVEDVSLQSFTGSYGFFVANGTIGFLSRCNAAPNGSASSNFFFTKCESMNIMNCEANGSPQYNLWMDGTTDSELYDFEANGAGVEQVHLAGCADIFFHRLYVFQQAPVGVHLVDSQTVGVNGGWVAGAEQTQLWMDTSSLGTTGPVFLEGLRLEYTNGSPAKGQVIRLTNNVVTASVVGCVFLGGRSDSATESGSVTGFSDQSLSSVRRVLFANNLFDGYGTGDTPVAVKKMPSSGSVLAVNNPGYNPAGRQADPPSLPGSGQSTANPFPFPCTVYLTGGIAPDVMIDGESIGASSGPVHLAPGQRIGLRYASAPRWVWIGG